MVVDNHEASETQTVTAAKTDENNKRQPSPAPANILEQKIEWINELFENKLTETDAFSTKLRFGTIIKLQADNKNIYNQIKTHGTEKKWILYIDSKRTETKNINTKRYPRRLHRWRNTKRNKRKSWTRDINSTKIHFKKTDRNDKNITKTITSHLVQIAPHTNPKTITKIEYIAYQKVRWEFIRKKNIPMQKMPKTWLYKQQLQSKIQMCRMCTITWIR